jgi:hypothetical protein
MSPKDYFNFLRNVKPNLVFRDKVCEYLGISIETFYRNLRDDKWTEFQLKVIKEVQQDVSKQFNINPAHV